MNYNYEIVTTPKKIPAKILVHTSPGVVTNHWHKDLELTFSYQGSFRSYVNGKIFSIQNKHLLLVNSGSIHSIIDYGKGISTTITILISYSFLKNSYSDIENIEFKLNEKSEKSIRRLKDIFEEIGSMYIQDMTLNNTPLVFVEDQKPNDEFHYLKINSLLYELLYILLSDFLIKKDLNIELKTIKHLERLKIITEFIDKNYKDNISLDEIASNYQISKEYLSTIFKKYMGITVGTYLKGIRLNSAYRDLVNTDYSINQLAFDNGFPNIKSFINGFKEYYGKTPYKYKKDIQNKNKLLDEK
jgi:AraC family transcriptional regulator, melibiose operon regulatory protein